MLEQVIKHAISGSDQDITILQFKIVFVGIIRLVLTNGVLLFQNLLKFGHFGQFTFGSENFKVSLSW